METRQIVYIKHSIYLGIEIIQETNLLGKIWYGNGMYEGRTKKKGSIVELKTNAR